MEESEKTKILEKISRKKSKEEEDVNKKEENERCLRLKRQSSFPGMQPKIKKFLKSSNGGNQSIRLNLIDTDSDDDQDRDDGYVEDDNLLEDNQLMPFSIPKPPPPSPPMQPKPLEHPKNDAVNVNLESKKKDNSSSSSSSSSQKHGQKRKKDCDEYIRELMEESGHTKQDQLVTAIYIPPPDWDDLFDKLKVD